MNPDEIFHCPKCRNAMQIPAWLWVKRELRKSGGPTVTISSDDSPGSGTLRCPSCGHKIPIEDIINPVAKKGCMGMIAVMAGLGFGAWSLLH